MARKSKNIQQPKRSGSNISFVVDGQCERWYLEKWKENEKLNVNLNPKFPKTKDLKKQFDLAVELSKESDKVFWVIDFDTILKETRQAKKGAKTPLTDFKELYKKCEGCEEYKNIIIVVNNPCLEYWFLLHYNQTAKHYDFYEPELKRDLEKVLSGYEKTEKYYKNLRQDIYKRLKDKLQTAIINAQKLGEFDVAEVESKGFAEIYKIFKDFKPQL